VTLLATTLAPGESTIGTLTHTVTQADLDAGSRTNIADATGTDPNGVEVTDQDTLTVIFAQNPSIDVVKTSDATGTNRVGDVITYTYTVTNTGDVTLANVTVIDTPDGPVTLSATTLAPSASTTGTATHTVKQADLDAGSRTNIADASGTGPNGTVVNDQDTLTVTFAQNPSIDVLKTSDATGTNSVGDVITYTYTVTNTGDVTLVNVTVIDTPDGPVTLSATTLAPSASTNGTATHTVTQADINAGSRTNIADASGTGPNGTLVNDQDTLTVTFAQNPAIDVEKYVSVDGGENWEDADNLAGPFFICDTDPQFKFVVTNTGNVDLTGIVLTDSDFDLSVCAVPDPLTPSTSYECVVPDPWVVVQHTNTANVIVYFDGTQYSDDDDANYYYRAPSS
jgi:uncharacterized repeat protein (TIGR01451 family)